MNKKSLTETDIRTKFITPAIVGANGEKWNVMSQVREEAYFTKGRVIVRGKTVKRGEAKKADYLLSYVMRITGDNDEGKAQLENCIDPESTCPVIACTSRLMSTGVDAQTCHLIVLERRIAPMTEFKQIIGRGTRINEDYGKFYLTIIDFRQATALFAHPDFDGDPVQIYKPTPDETPVPPDDYPEPGDKTSPGGFDEPEPDPARTKYYVNNVEVRVATERVQYLDVHGKLITEYLKDYSRKTVRQAYASLDDFLTAWHDADKKLVIFGELAAQGVFLDELAEQVGRDYGAFDLICHVAFDAPPLTRKERAEKVKKRNVFAKIRRQVSRRARCPPRRTTPDRGQSGATDGPGGPVGATTRRRPRHRSDFPLRPRRGTHRQAPQRQSRGPLHHRPPRSTAPITLTFSCAYYGLH